MKILIMGSSGMLGHKLFQIFSKNRIFETYGTVRTKKGLPSFFSESKNLYNNGDAFLFTSIEKIMIDVKPDIVINCIGIIKQLPSANDPITSIYINSLFPHKVAKLCQEINSRFIHISTDCVFDGMKGKYSELDESNAKDLYGRSKFLGEVTELKNTLTIRTSIIGHELNSKYGLVEWFLSQSDTVKGFTKAIYTGFPTVEICKIINKIIIPSSNLCGLYQISSDPISKYELLNLIAQQYKKEIKIKQENDFFCDRSLNSSKFKLATGYISPSWNNMVHRMYEDYISSKLYKKIGDN